MARSLGQRRRSRLYALTLVALAGLVAHCGSSDESLFGSGGPCETVYKGLCGVACSTDEQCASGLHCESGACTAACAPGSECEPGLSCDSRGRCTTQGSLPPSEPDDDASTSGDACVDFNLTLVKREPTIVLLIDQSASMDEPFDGGTRWTVLKDALLSDAGVINSLQSEVRFGLTMFGNTAGGACPDLTTIPIAINNYSPIRAVYGPAGMIPNTPTGESVLAVAGLTDGGLVDGGFAAIDAGGPKIILLATDGDPDTCTNPAANDPPLDPVEQKKAKDLTIHAVQRAHDAGIQTFVIAVGNEVSEAHQQEVANAGLGFNPDAGDAAPYFRPSNSAELKSNIDTVILGSRSCVFALNGKVQAGKESAGVVTVDGQRLAHADPDGWKLRSPSELELVGEACRTVRTKPNVSVSAKFPCGSVTGVR